MDKTFTDSKQTADRPKKPTTAEPLNGGGGKKGKPERIEGELSEDELKDASGGFVWGPPRIVPVKP